MALLTSSRPCLNSMMMIMILSVLCPLSPHRPSAHWFSAVPQHDQITQLQYLLSPTFHMYNPSLTDVEVLTLAVLVMVLIHAVHAEILLSVYTTPADWILAIDAFLEHHKDHLQEKADTIGSQVAPIVAEIENRSIIPEPKTIGPNTWHFSSQEAYVFAERLTECVKANLM
ncbi:hypothetical protein B0H16DRAFT_1523818 [Mycena metata]|uniref:Uncharacterized protein n=1 Tax=Mycena metata TaxID=1033252 RepID=A0AAD7NL17_9AGAR|nr:hypothetical protein B0H16DRAFT_1523818 [Mycena metata]